MVDTDLAERALDLDGGVVCVLGVSGDTDATRGDADRVGELYDDSVLGVDARALVFGDCAGDGGRGLGFDGGGESVIEGLVDPG